MTRRVRCDCCGQLYHLTDDHPLRGACPRCWDLYLRVDQVYPYTGPHGQPTCEAFRAYRLKQKARVREIVEHPAGEAAARLIERERLMREMEQMTPDRLAYFTALVEQQVKENRRARFRVVK